DTPPRTRPLRPTSPRPRTTRHGPVKQTPARPRGLLEPCAATSGKHGSEGAPAQKCAGATRQQKPLRTRHHLARRPPPSLDQKRTVLHGHPPEPRPRTLPPQRYPQDQRSHRTHRLGPEPSPPPPSHLK